MKAIVRNRVQNDHIELGQVVPLNTPYVLLVNPTDICNMRCRFCPTGHHNLIKQSGRIQTFLDFDLYKKIIDDLKDFDEPIRVLRLYKDGEPLMHKHFSEMVAYARKSPYINRIDTTTNGLCLNPKLNRELVNSGLDKIDISVNGVNAERIEELTGVRIDFDEYVANIRDLYEHKGNLEIYIKGIKENMSEDEQKKFFEIFGNITDRIFLEKLVAPWPEFELPSDFKPEFSTGNYGQNVIFRDVCPFIFYTMCIDPDGQSSFCLGDWKHCQIAGDAKIQSLKEIWLGKPLQDIRLAHLEGKRKEYKFCSECKAIVYGTLDNLDPYRDEIKERLLAEGQ